MKMLRYYRYYIKRNLTLVRSKGSPHHKTVESHYKSDEKSKKAEQATHASLGVKEVLITRLLSHWKKTA